MKEYIVGQISAPAWRGLNKPHQATPSPTVEMFCASVGTWVCGVFWIQKLTKMLSVWAERWR